MRRQPKPITARLVIEGICRKGTERGADHVLHKGQALLVDGYEFVSALGAWNPQQPIRLLQQGGNWPYHFSLAADDEKAMIEWIEGDVFVRVYDTRAAYDAALARYAAS
jgi:hypothetical protein